MCDVCSRQSLSWCSPSVLPCMNRTTSRVYGGRRMASVWAPLRATMVPSGAATSHVSLGGARQERESREVLLCTDRHRHKRERGSHSEQSLRRPILFVDMLLLVLACRTGHPVLAWTLIDSSPLLLDSTLLSCPLVLCCRGIRQVNNSVSRPGKGAISTHTS